MSEELDLEKIVAKIQKLLAKAEGTNNEHEAATFAAKAQEMLERYNLDVASIGKTAQGRPRKDQQQKGGLYGWQRALWKAVAELNFCTYWSIKGLSKGSTYEHRLLGSHANVVGTQVMAEYLQKAIERFAQQWAKDEGYQSVFVREAIAYREGMTARIVERLNQRREEQVREAKQRRDEEKARASHPAYAGGTALTIVDVMEDEADLNNDYLMGWAEGTTSANRRADEARRAAVLAQIKQKEEDQRIWDLEHPEEAAARKAKQQADNEAWWAEYYKKQAKSRSRSRSRAYSEPRARAQTEEEKRQSMPSYWQGREHGEKVNLDRQVDQKAKGAIK